MKSKEELDVLKEEFENLNKKLAELTEEELALVSGGNIGFYEDVQKQEQVCPGCGAKYIGIHLCEEWLR